MPNDINLSVELMARGHAWLDSYFNFERFNGTTDFVDFQYGNPIAKKRPPIPLQRKVYVNDTDSNFTITLSDTKKTSASMSWSIQQTVSFTQAVSLKFPIPFPVSEGVEGELEAVRKVEIQKTESQQRTFEQTWKIDYVQTMTTPRQRYEVDVIATQVSYDTPFSAKAVVSGSADFLKIGFGKPDITTSIAIGELFLRFPHDMVTVISPSSIAIALSGNLAGSFGEEVLYEIHQYPIY